MRLPMRYLWLKKHVLLSFDESIDVAVILGVNARKSDQNVRGATVLPNGLGKTVRVAVFADGDNAQALKRSEQILSVLRT